MFFINPLLLAVIPILSSQLWRRPLQTWCASLAETRTCIVTALVRLPVAATVLNGLMNTQSPLRKHHTVRGTVDRGALIHAQNQTEEPPCPCAQAAGHLLSKDQNYV